MTKSDNFNKPNEWSDYLTATIINMFQLKVIACGYVKLSTVWRCDKVFSPFARLYYIQEGEGIIEDSYGITVLKPGNVYLLPPGYEYKYRCDDYLHKFFFHINVIKEDGYDLFMGLNKCLSLPVSKSKTATLARLYNNKSTLYALKFKEELYRIVGEFTQIAFSKDSLNLNLSPVTKTTIDYIQKNLSISLTLEQIAKDTFTSSETIRKKFKKEMGISVGRYIDDMVFYSAENMLCTTNYTIRKISEILGFSDQFYFSRRFSEKYNYSPLRYRKLRENTL